jgi:cell division septation protein DedD
LDITAFIRELLFGHDCVIVPGFGGFVCNYMPSRIDRSSGTFHPPVRQITFNRNLVHNDGLLIQKICSAGLTYGDARSMVEEFVSGIRKELERGEEVSLEKIGVFRKNHEGSLEFEPDSNVNYHLDSFGLEPFRCYPLEGYDVRKRIIPHGEVHRSTFRKYLWRAAVIIPLAVAVVAVSLKTNLFRPGLEITTMNPLLNAQLEHNRAAVDSMAAGVQNTEDTAVQVGDALAPEVMPVIEDTPAEQPAVSEKAVNDQASASPVPSKETGNAKITAVRQYYIITGSFQSEENAGKQARLLQAEGLNPQVVDGENGFYRVCAMACPDLQTAIEKKDVIEKKFPGSWISRKK